ncbi:MAG: hypothetical protein LBS99_02345 [Clostridiales bacterium]|jgi:hypothetical protein|nr:hypothetical protein [Clostridiales bacterium]
MKKIIRSVCIALCALTIGLGLAACGGGTPTTAAEAAKAVGREVGNGWGYSPDEQIEGTDILAAFVKGQGGKSLIVLIKTSGTQAYIAEFADAAAAAAFVVYFGGSANTTPYAGSLISASGKFVILAVSYGGQQQITSIDQDTDGVVAAFLKVTEVGE